MADHRRKLTDSDIIADKKLLTVAESVSRDAAFSHGSRHFVAIMVENLRQTGLDCAIDVSQSGDRGLFLLH
jgi:hypothetical protein